jgi:hypothetical protein
LCFSLTLLVSAGCGDDEGGLGNENEVITTVSLIHACRRWTPSPSSSTIRRRRR